MRRANPRARRELIVVVRVVVGVTGAQENARGPGAFALAFWFVLGVALVQMTACGHGRGSADGVVVKSLDIEGTRALSERQIKQRIATAETGWWWPLAKKQRYDPVAWQSDLGRVERFYESQGYYQAEVRSDEVKPVKGGVALKVVVSEGEPTRIGFLAVNGLEALDASDRAHILDGLSLRAGEVFLEDRWQDAKDLLQARARARGYAQVRLDGRALVDVKTRQAALSLNVIPGRRYVFGSIEVKQGPGARIAGVWVWEQVRLAIPEGSWFNDDALTEAQRRVVAMGIFSSAKVTIGKADDAQGTIPVLVEVFEAPPHILRTGVGVRVDQIRNEGRGILEWSDRNFRGGMRRLTAHAEAGWAFIPNTYAVLSNDGSVGPRNGPVARLGLDFEQPRLWGRPSLRGRNSLTLEKTLEQAYDALGGREAVGVVWQPRASLSLYPSYNLQGYWLDGPPVSSAAAAPLTLGCVTQSDQCFIVLSYVEQLVTWDRRDNPLEARNGFYASISLQQGGGPLRGDFTYVRALPDVRGYISFGEDDRLTFAGRLRVGELKPFGGQSAVVSRFYGGGGISMRGFNDRRLSPLLLAPAPNSSADAPVTLTLPIGGDGMIDGSFEARYQITSNFVLAAFVDFGQVTRGRVGPDDLRGLLWAVGVGVRYRTPIGPIRLDFARRLRVGRLPPLFSVDGTTGALTQVPYRVDDSCLGLGGSGVATEPGISTAVRDNLCVLHISIGEAF